MPEENHICSKTASHAFFRLIVGEMKSREKGESSKTEMWNLRRIFSMGAPKSQFLERVLEKLKRKAISGPGTLLHKGSQEIMEKQRIPCLAKQHDDSRS